MGFPPVPVFPEDLDTDYTLFLVHNTTETRLCEDNSAWSEEIVIVPVGEDELEIWGDNGFGNIDGELFYYDSVEKNANGKVFKLTGCARNIGGSSTKFNHKGTWVRSFVVAEHHNQITEAILKTENFIGYNFDPRHETLDWRIRNLRELNIIFDDYNCPDLNFTFNIIENNTETGILVRYDINVTPPSSVNTFRLDFGDGQFTTSNLSGEHRYAINANIDPIVTIGNDLCTVIQSAITRENPNEPPGVVESVFEVPIPDIPSIPDFTIVPCEFDEPELILPPVVNPCFSFEGQAGLPSVIIGPDINMVSTVEIIGPTNPINITQSVVHITGDINIPSMIFVDIPPTLVIDPPIPPTIVLLASNATSMAMGVNYADVPNIQVDWGSPPPMEVALAFAKQPKKIPITESLHNDFGEEFADLFEASEHIKVEYETVGLPSEIKIVAPEFPHIQIDGSSVPRSIDVNFSECNIPKDIFVHVDGALKTGVIKIDGSIPDQIELRHTLPEVISLVPVDIPQFIELKMEERIPDKILVEMVQPIPERILLEGIPDALRVEGIPSVIEVVGFPDFIPLKFPDEIPQMELVYKGAPLEMKVVMDPMVKSTDGKTNCVMIVPCSH
jgi:hypothetical protein